VFKYVPYGKINEVVPYLIRRAEENSSILGIKRKKKKKKKNRTEQYFNVLSLGSPAVIEERDMIFNELKSRMKRMVGLKN
jgi:hypothetical protein